MLFTMVQLREARSQDGWVHIGKVQRELSRHQELLKRMWRKSIVQNKWSLLYCFSLTFQS